MYYIRLPFSFGLKKSCKIRKKIRINIRRAKSLHRKQRLLQLCSAVYPSQLQSITMPAHTLTNMHHLSLKRLRPRLPFYPVSKKDRNTAFRPSTSTQNKQYIVLFLILPRSPFSSVIYAPLFHRNVAVQSVFIPDQKQPRISHNNPVFHHKFFQKIH